MPSWRRIFTSEEARIESLAGQSLPPDGLAYVDGVAEQGLPEYEAWLRRYLRERGDWPQELPPPFAADDEDDAEPWLAPCDKHPQYDSSGCPICEGPRP